MYPFRILTDEHIPLKLLVTKYLLMILNRYIKQYTYNDF